MDGPHSDRGPTRRFLMRLALALLVTLVVLQAANWYATTDAVREAVVDEEVEGWDSFVDLVAGLAAESDVAGFDDMITTIAELDPSTDIEQEAESTDLVFSWHTEERDEAISGVPLRTPLVDEVLASGGRHTSVDGNRLEYVRRVSVADGQIVLRAEFELVALDRVMGGVRDQLLLFGGLALVLAIGVFFAVGGLALVRSHHRALALGLRDSLTGLGNHRAFFEELPRAIARSDRAGTPLALLVVDVDAFKSVNDNRGHPAGDLALRTVARAFTTARLGDRAFRLGGDEFALLATDTDVGAAQVLAERIRATAHAEAEVTLSVGIAITRTVVDPHELWRQADRALYRAKRSGRDSTALADVA